MIRIRREVSDPLQAPDVDAVTSALQFALELEHATIPPYLYAMWSLGTGPVNADAAGIILDIIGQEMRHMAMVANIINALGATPVTDSESVIPKYPSVLPGSVESGLEVGLAPFSLDLVQNTFMVIEQPEHPLEFHAAAAAAPLTIGEFYRTIKTAISRLGDGAFSVPERNQITGTMVSGVVKVTNVVTATQAIDTIIDQGEGTTTSPSEVEGGTDFAHFYRFAEIFHGHLLVPNPAAGPSDPPDQQFTFSGDAIGFAPEEVLAVPVDPKTETYPEGSAARRACDDFNVTYTGMLKSLQLLFNGQANQLAQAKQAMFALQRQGPAMMAGTGLEMPAGPTFEWREAGP